MKFPRKTQKKLLLAAIGSLVLAFANRIPTFKPITVSEILIGFVVFYFLLWGYDNPEAKE